MYKLGTVTPKPPQSFVVYALNCTCMPDRLQMELMLQP
jgi:hypothetical protein